MTVADGVRRLRIESLAAGGDGVGRDEEGRVTFVPHTAPGDVVTVRVTESRKQFARAELADIEEPGPGRVEPPCRYFAESRCGGCQWQHVSIDVQREAKRELASRALRRVLPEGAEVELAPAVVPAYGWRRRARMHWFRPRDSERALIGFFPPRSKRVVDIDVCAQLEAPLQEAVTAARAVLAPGLHKQGELDLLLGEDDLVHVVVRGPSSAGAARALAEQGRIAGVRARGRLFGDAAVAVDGAVTAADRFAQASTVGNAALVEAVDRATRPRERAHILELYAGAGNFTRRLVDGAEHVVAVDVATGEWSHPGLEWKQGDAAEIAAEYAQMGARFDLVVLDPPRTGARELCDALVELRPSRLVYVSCDPMTLARDVEQLVGGGFEIGTVTLLDLMPQTSHSELVLTATYPRKTAPASR